MILASLAFLYYMPVVAYFTYVLNEQWWIIWWCEIDVN